MERTRPERDDLIIVAVIVGVARTLTLLLSVGHLVDSSELMDIASTLWFPLVFGCLS